MFENSNYFCSLDWWWKLQTYTYRMCFTNIRLEFFMKFPKTLQMVQHIVPLCGQTVSELVRVQSLASAVISITVSSRIPYKKNLYVY